MTLALALLFASTCVSAPGAPWGRETGALALAPCADPVSGTWEGLYEPPGTVGGQPFALVLELRPDGAVGGRLAVREGSSEFAGRFDAPAARVSLRGETTEGRPLELALVVEGERLVGEALTQTLRTPIVAVRTSPEALERDLRPPTLALDRERPATFTLVGLPDELGFAVDDRLLAFARESSVVGISVGFVLAGELTDVRSLGWADLPADVPASGETQYRWASISKPLTAVTAVAMASEGQLDLERDVRTWVPEFPEKTGVVTPLAILGHLSGITHYRDAIRTWRTYQVPQPFEDRILALDIFKETPLIAPPGTRYSYSTHAYSVLGAAMQRAGEKRYEELVAERVLVPLGMRSTFPDFQSRSIPHRSRGYLVVEGGVVDAGDDDVSWKLPGGGWTSTVGDLGRFAAGLTREGWLTEAHKRLLWTPRTTSAGESTGYGLGFEVGALEGRRLVSHSGAQRKSRTYMALLPDDGLAVVVMCNTEGTQLQGLTEEFLRLILTLAR